MKHQKRPVPEKHGVNAYASGRCRCAEKCQPAWAAYHAKRRRKTRGQRAKPVAAVAIGPRALYPGKRHDATSSLTDIGYGILRLRKAERGLSNGDIFEEFLRDSISGPTGDAAQAG